MSSFCVCSYVHFMLISCFIAMKLKYLPSIRVWVRLSCMCKRTHMNLNVSLKKANEKKNILNANEQLQCVLSWSFNASKIVWITIARNGWCARCACVRRIKAEQTSQKVPNVHRITCWLNGWAQQKWLT